MWAKAVPYQPMFQPPVLNPGSDILEQEPEDVKLGCRANRSSMRVPFPVTATSGKSQTHTRTPPTYVSTVGHHKVRWAAGKRPEGVWYPLRPRLGFKHAAEHSQRLHVPEPAVMSQPGEKGDRRGEGMRRAGGRMTVTTAAGCRHRGRKAEFFLKFILLKYSWFTMLC